MNITRQHNPTVANQIKSKLDFDCVELLSKMSKKNINTVYDDVILNNIPLRQSQILINGDIQFPIIHYKFDGYVTYKDFDKNTYKSITKKSMAHFSYFGIKITDIFKIFKFIEKNVIEFGKDSEIALHTGVYKKILKINPDYDFNPILALNFSSLVTTPTKFNHTLHNFANHVVLFDFTSLYKNENCFDEKFFSCITNVCNSFTIPNMQRLINAYFLNSLDGNIVTSTIITFDEPKSFLEVGRIYCSECPTFHKVKNFIEKRKLVSNPDKIHIYSSISKFDNDCGDLWWNINKIKLEDFVNIYFSSWDEKYNNLKSVENLYNQKRWAEISPASYNDAKAPQIKATKHKKYVNNSIENGIEDYYYYNTGTNDDDNNDNDDNYDNSDNDDFIIDDEVLID